MFARNEPVKAHARWDISGVHVTVGWETPDGYRVRDFSAGREYVDVPANQLPPQGVELPLTDAEARGLYEALADYYGHTSVSAAALRKDYDAERARVDRLIAHLTSERST